MVIHWANNKTTTIGDITWSEGIAACGGFDHDYYQLESGRVINDETHSITGPPSVELCTSPKRGAYLIGYPFKV